MYSNYPMRVLFLLSFGLLLGSAGVLRAQFSVTVSDPQRGWSGGTGLIEESVVAIRPHGKYSEVDMTLVFSARGNESQFKPGTQLELLYHFDLPAEALVTDSWLWIDTTVIRADILDRWTATSVYEQIVNRRRDPSLLVKDSDTHYRLHIYPLPMGQTRKVKLTFLVPNQWTAQDVLTSLDGGFWAVSPGMPDVELQIFPSDEWKNPRITTHPDVRFYPQYTEEAGDFLVARIPWHTFSVYRPLSVAVDAPWHNGIYLSRYGDSTGGTYQLGILPAALIESSQGAIPQRLLVLLQFNPLNSPSITADTYRQAIRDQLKAVLRPGDYFNVMYAGLAPAPVSTEWIPASADAIQRVFDHLDVKKISSSYLPGLLGKGMNWIRDQEVPAKLVLLANSSAEGDPNTANPLLKELGLFNQDTKPVPCFVGDFQSGSYGSPYYYVGGVTYYGNGYFYENLARQSKGEFFQLKSCCSTFADLVEKTLYAALSQKGLADLHTGMRNGFCFSRFFMNNAATSSLDLRQPLFHIGKYHGHWPMLAEFAGQFNGIDFFSTTLLAEPSAQDSVLATLWNGMYLLGEEKKTQTNATRADIISRSVQHRILSRYTAFLCLEPGLSVDPCPTCSDGNRGGVVGIDEQAPDSLVSVSFAPNPFAIQTTILLSFADTYSRHNLRIAVHNLLGQEVFAFENTLDTRDGLQLEWDGRDQGGKRLPGGTYFLVLRGSGIQKAFPLVFAPRP